MSAAPGPASLFDGVRAKSRLAISMALAMRENRGLEGWMLVYIPSDERTPCEVMTTTHGWRMTMDSEGFEPPRTAPGSDRSLPSR